MMTPGRWVAMCVLGCALMAVTLLPPDLSGDDLYFGWRPRVHSHEQMMQQRAQIWRWHGQQLWMAYQVASDAETAQRVFGSRPSNVSGPFKPVIWFDSDVPGAARRAVSEAIAAEVAARGEWHGHGAVGLLVFMDTATTLGGAPMPWAFLGNLTLTTQVLPANRATGDRCVTVVRLGPKALTGDPSAIPADGLLLDGCAFYDAFGAPGPAISAWLYRERFAFARTLSFASADTTLSQIPLYARNLFYIDDEARARCAGGDLAACATTLHRSEAGNLSWSYYWGSPDRSVPASASHESTRLFNGASHSDSPLQLLVRDLGPARFQRVWQSPRPIEQAYFDVTGEALAGWLRRQLVSYAGPYHIGPLPTPTSALLTIVAIVALMAASVRFAKRPTVA
jgi:hypothetical protein